jgi:hypothetical protein
MRRTIAGGISVPACGNDTSSGVVPGVSVKRSVAIVTETSLGRPADPGALSAGARRHRSLRDPDDEILEHARQAG